MRNNDNLRALFCLPAITPSASTAIAAPEMPAPKVVTGDQQVDAVLWLQHIVSTGNRALIDKAIEAVKSISTPMDELGKRYGAHVARSTGSTMGGAFASFGFGNLEAQAKRAIDKADRRHEALARFGDADTAFADTPAERACKKALRGLKRDKKFGSYDDAEVQARFSQAPELAPATISDCLHARDYWSQLYWLRNSLVEYGGESSPQGSAHEDFCYTMLAHIQPCNAAEAIAAFDHLDADDGTDWERGQPIIRNLIASGWNASTGDAQ